RLYRRRHSPLSARAFLGVAMLHEAARSIRGEPHRSALAALRGLALDATAGGHSSPSSRCTSASRAQFGRCILAGWPRRPGRRCVSTLLTVVAVIVGVPGAVAALHLGRLSAESVTWRPPRRPHEVPRLRFCLVVPAHDEERTLGATLSSLGACMRPVDQLV